MSLNIEKYIKTNCPERDFAYSVVENVAYLNKVNEPLHSKQRKRIALRVFEAAQRAWPRSRVYMNFRKRFIAVKVEQPNAADAFNIPEQLELKRLLDSGAIEVHTVATDRSIIYRIR